MKFFVVQVLVILLLCVSQGFAQASNDKSAIILFEEFIEGFDIEDRYSFHSEIFIHGDDDELQLEFSILTLKYWEHYERVMEGDDSSLSKFKDLISSMKMRAIRTVLKFSPDEDREYQKKNSHLEDVDLLKLIARDAEEKLGKTLTIQSLERVNRARDNVGDDRKKGISDRREFKSISLNENGKVDSIKDGKSRDWLIVGAGIVLIGILLFLYKRRSK